MFKFPAMVEMKKKKNKNAYQNTHPSIMVEKWDYIKV